MVGLALLVMVPVFADTIITRSMGGKQKMEVEAIGDETYRKVRYLQGGEWTNINSEDVVDVIRNEASMSSAYREANRQKTGGNWPEAARRFKQVIESGNAKKWEKQYAKYWLAYCTFMLGRNDRKKFEEAFKLFDDFIRSEPEHRLVPQAYRDKGKVAMALGKTADAKAAFNKLATETDFGKYWNVVGRYWQGEMEYHQGNMSAAERIWGAIIIQAKSMGIMDVGAKYNLVKAEKALRSKQYARAIAAFETVAKSSPLEMDPVVAVEVMSRAHNGLGQCYMASAGNNKDKLYKAYFEFLKTITLYKGASKEYKEALQSAIAILKKLKELAKDDREREDIDNLIAEHHDELARAK